MTKIKKLFKYLFKNLFKSNRIGISIGNNCKAASYGKSNGLRKSKKTGYKTCPFDLCVTNIEGIIECLNTNFKDFCNPNYLQCNVDSNIISHLKYGFVFNHESPFHANLYIKEKWKDGPYHFVKDNYNKFSERYERRIKNFDNYCNSGNRVIFILHFEHDVYTQSLMNKLNKAIKSKYHNLIYTIKIINS